MKFHFLIALPLFLSLSPAAAAGDCTVRRDVLFGALSHPELASNEEWRAASREIQSLMLKCTAGPTVAESRRRLFEYIDQELSLDFGHLCEVWAARNDPCTEAQDEVLFSEHEHMRLYLDKIVDPRRDQREAAIILRHGNGPAMAKLGRPVMAEVMQLASVPPLKRPELHDTQTEAIRALGAWIDPANREFDSGEKSMFISLALAALPPADGEVWGYAGGLAKACLQSLGKSSIAVARARLLTWERDRVAATRRGRSDEYAQLARKAIEAIERREAKQKR